MNARSRPLRDHTTRIILSSTLRTHTPTTPPRIPAHDAQSLPIPIPEPNKANGCHQDPHPHCHTKHIAAAPDKEHTRYVVRIVIDYPICQSRSHTRVAQKPKRQPIPMLFNPIDRRILIHPRPPRFKLRGIHSHRYVTRRVRHSLKKALVNSPSRPLPNQPDPTSGILPHRSHGRTKNHRIMNPRCKQRIHRHNPTRNHQRNNCVTYEPSPPQHKKPSHHSTPRHDSPTSKNHRTPAAYPQPSFPTIPPQNLHNALPPSTPHFLLTHPQSTQ